MLWLCRPLPGQTGTASTHVVKRFNPDYPADARRKELEMLKAVRGLAHVVELTGTRSEIDEKDRRRKPAALEMRCACH
jgi:hypothetical protein